MNEIKSFEEFHTSQKRQRAWDQANSREWTVDKGYEKKEKDDEEEKNIPNDNDNDKSLSRHTIGRILETFEVQLFIVLLIYLDLIACTITYVFENDIGTLTSAVKVEKLVDNDSALLRLFSSLESFITICFVIEMGGLIYSFGMSIFSHIGYCLDMVIIVSLLYNNVYEFGVDLVFPLQFLGYLRCWRVARLVTTLVSRVEHDHEETKLELNEMKRLIEAKITQCNRLEALNANEVILRKQVEKSLYAYKDEVETLKEALKIAAMDVSINAKGEMENIGTVDKIHSEDGKADKFIDQNGDDFYDSNNGNEEKLKVLSNDRIVVNNDGTFEHK